MTKFIIVDVEAAEGPSPATGVMTEFGAVEMYSGRSYHGVLYDAVPSEENPAVPIRLSTEPYDIHKVMTQFAEWLKSFNERVVFVSDNPAFDYQWISYYFDSTLGYNPFGHSARRIGDFYAGLTRKWENTNKWKRYRLTEHDHNPVNDAMGNAEALRYLIRLNADGVRFR